MSRLSMALPKQDTKSKIESVTYPNAMEGAE